MENWLQSDALNCKYFYFFRKNQIINLLFSCYPLFMLPGIHVTRFSGAFLIVFNTAEPVKLIIIQLQTFCSIHLMSSRFRSSFSV